MNEQAEGTSKRKYHQTGISVQWETRAALRKRKISLGVTYDQLINDLLRGDDNAS